MDHRLHGRSHRRQLSRALAIPGRAPWRAAHAAYYRQFSDIAFASEVVALIGAEEAYAKLARDYGLDRDQLTPYAPMFEARYESVSELIRKSGPS